MFKLLHISEICYIIQRLNSYNLLTNKVAEKVPWTIYRPDEKKLKKYQRVRNGHLASVSKHVRKKFKRNLLTQLIEFFDQDI